MNLVAAALLPVIFVHGLGSDKTAWDAQVAHFGAGRAVAVDLRGHGKAPRPADRDYSFTALASDVDKAARKAGFKKFVLVGHSMSGMVISKYAGLHPDKVAALVYVDAAGDLSQAPADVRTLMTNPPPGFDAAKMKTMYGHMVGEKARPQTRERVLKMADALDPKAFLAIRKQMAEYSPKADFARFKGPRFCLEAAANESPTRASKTVPECKTKVIANVSHWLMLDDPAAVNAALDEFLK